MIRFKSYFSIFFVLLVLMAFFVMPYQCFAFAEPLSASAVVGSLIAVSGGLIYASSNQSLINNMMARIIAYCADLGQSVSDWWRSIGGPLCFVTAAGVLRVPASVYNSFVRFFGSSVGHTNSFNIGGVSFNINEQHSRNLQNMRVHYPFITYSGSATAWYNVSQPCTIYFDDLTDFEGGNFNIYLRADSSVYPIFDQIPDGQFFIRITSDMIQSSGVELAFIYDTDMYTGEQTFNFFDAVHFSVIAGDSVVLPDQSISVGGSLSFPVSGVDFLNPSLDQSVDISVPDVSATSFDGLVSDVLSSDLAIPADVPVGYIPDVSIPVSTTLDVSDVITMSTDRVIDTIDRQSPSVPSGYTYFSDFDFLGIWHYVVDFANSGSGFFSPFLSLVRSLPSVFMLPLYASVVVLLVSSLWKRLIG